MAGIERARTVGELIRPADGTVWPLILPITLIGSGDRCDVKISGSGIAELHCALALTPAGLTLRSWNPEFTLLDGQPTAAAVLSDGREIRIGSEMFRLSWNVPVAPEDSASPVALLSQLHIAREQFRLEREAADAETGLRTKQSRKAESKVREGEIAVALDKKRVRALYETCLRKLKSKWVAERASCERTRADTGAAEARFREYAERTRLELDRREERLRDDRARLKAAWELLADGQRRQTRAALVGVRVELGLLVGGLGVHFQETLKRRHFAGSH